MTTNDAKISMEKYMRTNYSYRSSSFSLEINERKCLFKSKELKGHFQYAFGKKGQMEITFDIYDGFKCKVLCDEEKAAKLGNDKFVSILKENVTEDFFELSISEYITSKAQMGFTLIIPKECFDEKTLEDAAAILLIKTNTIWIKFL